MATSKSTVLNLKIKKQHGTKLFYKKYRYCVDFEMEGVVSLRNILQVSSREMVEDHVNTGIEYYTRSQISPVSYWGRPNANGSREVYQFLNSNGPDQLKLFAQELYDLKDQIHFKVNYYNNAFIYSNQLATIEQLLKDKNADIFGLRESVVSRPADTFVCRHTRHTYRSYLNESRISFDTKSNIAQFLQNQNSAEVRLSKSLIEFFRLPNSRFVERHYFFECSDERIINMFNIVAPGIIRETLTNYKVNN